MLRTLNAVLDRTEHIVLTSRTEQYRAAVEAGDVLTGVAVIELQPLQFETLAAYLPRTTRPDGTHGPGTKWAPVLRHLRNNPDEPSSRSVSTVLSTPLMVWLARAQYSDTDADPTQLLRPEFNNPYALRRHLLDGLVTAAYADPGRHHQRRLPATKAERWLIRLAALLASSGSQNLQWWQLADRMPLRAVRVVLTTSAAVLSAVTAMIVLGLNNSLGSRLLLGSLFGAVVGVAVWLIPWLRRRPEPTTVGSITLMQAFRGVSQIMVIGLVPIFAVMVNIVTETTWQPASNWVWSLIAVITLISTTVVGLVGAPVETERAVCPQRLLRADRASAIVQGCLIGFAAGLLAATAAWTALPASIALTIGAAFGVSSGLVWSIVGSAWGRFALVRLYWWSTGRLPLRLMTFLADAHRRGILRQVGATYQFRHELLQAHLAGRA